MEEFWYLKGSDMFDVIVSSHTNPSLSGVAKFNSILSQKLNIPCVGFGEVIENIQEKRSYLVSIKLNDMNNADILTIKKFLDECRKKKVNFDVFFHTFDGISIEYDMLARSNKIFCGNSEIKHALEGFEKILYDAWCPHLLNTSNEINESEFNIFSFGMVHKLQTKYYKMLHDRLEEQKKNYSLWVSTAFHEKANFGDFASISNELTSIYGDRIYFLGFLSDESINYFMTKVHLFIAFFSKGVRSNNTSIYVPMKKGLPVLTNLDVYSPKWMKQGENILDINNFQCSCLSKENLKRIGMKAKNDVKAYASWDSLIKLMSDI